jgi:hypothetical protein
MATGNLGRSTGNVAVSLMYEIIGRNWANSVKKIIWLLGVLYELE